MADWIRPEWSMAILEKSRMKHDQTGTGPEWSRVEQNGAGLELNWARM
jgi:hypothetical protein